MTFFVSVSGANLHLGLNPFFTSPFRKNYEDLCFSSDGAGSTKIKSNALNPGARFDASWWRGHPGERNTLHSEVSLGTNLEELP